MQQSRRDLLIRSGHGFGTLALASLLHNEPLAAADKLGQGRLASGLHHPAKAKRVIQLFMAGTHPCPPPTQMQWEELPLALSIVLEVLRASTQ